MPVFAFVAYHTCPQDNNREMGEINRRTAAVQRRHDGIATPRSTGTDEAGNQSDKEIVDEEAKVSDANEPKAGTSTKNKSKRRVGVTVGNQALGRS